MCFDRLAHRCNASIGETRKLLECGSQVSRVNNVTNAYSLQRGLRRGRRPVCVCFLEALSKFSCSSS